MKKFYLIFSLLLLSSIALVSAIETIEAPIEQTTSVTLGYGRSVIIKAVDGFPPYSFYGSSCVSLASIDDDEVRYTGNDNGGTCTTEFLDFDYFEGYVAFDVTCVCDACTTDTDGAMSGDGVTFEELAQDDTEPGPDENAQC